MIVDRWRAGAARRRVCAGRRVAFAPRGHGISLRRRWNAVEGTPVIPLSWAKS